MAWAAAWITASFAGVPGGGLLAADGEGSKKRLENHPASRGKNTHTHTHPPARGPGAFSTNVRLALFFLFVVLLGGSGVERGVL